MLNNRWYHVYIITDYIYTDLKIQEYRFWYIVQLCINNDDLYFVQYRNKNVFMIEINNEKESIKSKLCVPNLNSPIFNH